MDKQEQVWYELEYSHAGEDDWYASSSAKVDTEAGIRMLLDSHNQLRHTLSFEYRMVRKTLSTEVVHA